MSAPAPPHSVGTHMPKNPSWPISASSDRGISPAASQARTCGAIFSTAKARAVSRIRICSSVRIMVFWPLPRELGAVVVDEAAGVGRLQVVDHLHHGGHALLHGERRRPGTHY